MLKIKVWKPNRVNLKMFSVFFQAKIPNGSKIVIQPYKEIAENLSVYENRYEQ
jgi:hypothetical protein